MVLFGSPFDAEIEKATSETNTNENWSLILDVCDKVSSNPRNAKDFLKAIMKRMGHSDPHVVMQAITLLDACVNNCGKSFHLEIASREFETEFRRLLVKAQPKVSLKMRQVLKSWVENDFKSDSELNLIPGLYAKLRHEGFEFSNINDKPKTSAAKTAALKDPNVVSSQQEEDDIVKAIELSLKETKNSPKHQSGSSTAAAGNSSASTAYPSLYPSFTAASSGASITSTVGASNTSVNTQPEIRKVRALYDFEAAEENELTFFSGEIINVVDDSDQSWWKGFNQRGEGLFPSNFVSADLSVDPERLDINQQTKAKKTVQFEDDARELQEKTEAVANQRIEIDESKIDRLLHLLHEANPEDPSQDSSEMLQLEQEVNQMGPLIDAELERVDRKHAQLTQLSSDLVDAINLYHSLMRDDRAAMLGGAGGGGGYQIAPNTQMMYGAAGYNGANFPQQIPQNYGMSSLPFMGVGGANAGQMPTTTATLPPTSQPPPGLHNATGGGAFNAHAAGLMQMSNTIPMQFHNGHVNPSQLNGGFNAIAHGQAQQQPQQQMYGTGEQGGIALQQQQYLQQQQPPITTTTAIHNPQLQQTQQQPPTTTQQPQPYMPHHHPAAGYMQHAQQQHQFPAMPNGPQQHFITQQPPPPTGMLASGGIVNHNNHNGNPPNAEHFSQLQQHMAAMSMVSMNNQPVTQNFLVQNEPKNNIPIYQQQR